MGFENIQTPAGVEKRTAKLESRFNLPVEAATRIARSIQKKAGSGTGGMAGGGGGAGAGAPMGGGMPGGMPGGGGAGAGAGGGADAEPVDFKTVRVSVSREIWFDIVGNQVLRSNDVVSTFYEEEEAETGGGAGAGGAMGGGMGMARGGMPGGMGMAGGGEAGGAGGQPKKVTYDLRISKYLDDVIPAPTDSFNGGAGTAHARDNVQDPSIDRITRGG